VGEIVDALQRAAANTATRPIPKSAQAQMRFLLKAEKGSTRALRRSNRGRPNCRHRGRAG
jgi:hypothetical protein